MRLSNFAVKRSVLLIVLILFLGFWLRYQNLTTWPRHGATFDEFAWVWLGINLIQKGVPISWSPHPQYKERQEIRYQGAAFLIVKPYLEHPPLFGLVAGSFALLNGVRDMYHVTLEKIRPLSLILGTLSVFMIFLLTKEIYDKKVALMTSLLYATVPTIVIGSRIVQNENFLIPMWFLSLFLIIRYLKTGKKRFRNAASIIAGLLSLAKVPWLVVGASLVMTLSYKQKWKDALFVGVITAIFFSLFIVYGLYFDRELFFSLWKLQLARYDLSFISFYTLFTSPLLVDRYYLDGWIYFGLLSLFMLLKDFKKHIFIILPFLAYFLVFVVAIPDEPGHGWYRYPFYPFIILSMALFIKEYFSKNYVLTFFFLIFVGLSLSQLTWAIQFGFSPTILRIIVISVSIVLLPLFLRGKKIENISHAVSYLWFALLILLNIWSIYLYNEQ